MKHEFSTERFDVFKATVDRRFIGFECKELPLGAAPRDVYLAFSHSEDEPKCVATITADDCEMLGGVYIEWIDVTEDYRRKGVAFELLTALEAHVGKPLICDGVTDGGKALENKLAKLASETAQQEPELTKQ